MSKIRVLHLLVSTTYNGAENVVCQISDLFKSDNDIEIIYCSPDGPIRTALEEKGVQFAPLKNLSIKEIRRVVKELKPNIVHAHDMRANFLAYLSIGNIPLVSHIHNNNFDSRGLSLKSLLFYLAAQKSKHIFWVSKTSFDGYFLKSRLKRKSEILYNVINIDNIKRKANSDLNSYDYDVVYLGRLTFQKNPQRLVKIMHRIAMEEPNIKFAILGEGELGDEVKDYISKNNLSHNIHFLGYNSNPYKILKDSKAMLMTSRWEGLPMCALEAFALGVPVVSTPADGLKELIVNGISGFVSDDDNELISKIVSIYKNPEYNLSLSNGAYKKANEIMNLDNYKRIIRETYYRYLK